MKKGLFLFVLSVICTMTFAQNAKPQWNKVTSDRPETFKTQLVSSSESSIKVNVQVPGFYTTTVTTPRGEANVITLPKSVSTAEAGEPNVPMTGIPVMIGDKARMNVRVIDAQYRDFEGIEVAPSKGDFSRQIDPATVPYTYGDCYSQDAFFPSSNLDLYEPYIIRDFRGQNMAVYPFAYNPVTKTLRVYYNMTVEMYKVDNNGKNIIENRRSSVVKMSQDFKSMYQRHFLNFEEGLAKYTPVDDEGDLLIICYDNFISNMTDFVNWKKTRGINTTIVGTSTAGSTYSAIQSYIQSQYNANNNLTHVLLVGDVAQIPGYTYTGASGYEGKGDNPYGQVVGNDIYNDVFIGRFSASSAAQVTTQVNRTITYEKELTTNDTWCQNGLGISASAGNGGHYNEDDYQHVENLRTDLLNFGYSTVYQDYASVSNYPTSSTTTISNHINSGVGIINYCNHGEETGWQSHYYMNSHVNALTNENKLPFIFSVACLVGQYDYSSDCFAETWMRATNSNTPTGAIGGAFSYISQPWIPPMWAQDEFVDILVESYSNNIKHTLAGAAVNGMMAIFDNYSTSTASAVGTYQAWIVYGDPTLTMRTKTPQAMTVNHEDVMPVGSTSFQVNVSNGDGALATLTDANHNILGKATVSNGIANISLTGTPNPGEELTLCVFGYNKVTYLGTVTVIALSGPYITLDSYTPTEAHVGDNTNLSLTFKNLGTSATSGNTTVTLTGNDNVTILSDPMTFGALAADATTTVNGFSFKIAEGVADGTVVTLHYAASNGGETWEGNFNITAGEAILEYAGMAWDGGFTPGETLTLSAKFKNTGHWQATNAKVNMATSSNYLDISNPTVNVGTIAVDEEITCEFTVTIAANCPETEVIPVAFTMTADNNLSATGNENLKNACNVVFNLADSYGDGWNGAALVVSFDDGSASQSLTVSSGNSASYTLEIGNGTHVTLTWTSGSYDGECTFSVQYEGDLTIFEQTSRPSAGVLYEFDCNCAAATQTFTVTATSSNTAQGTVSGGGEFSYGQSCTVTATANTGYFFTGWTSNGTLVSGAAQYTFNVTSDMNLVANFAEGLEIGTASSNSNFLPTYSWYKQSFTEQIYTADEIGLAGSINSIAFYNEGAEKTRTLDLYLKATDKSAFSSKTDWVVMSDSDKVFSGEVTLVADSWTFLVFDTPFEHDGTSNIVIAVDDNSGAYTSSPHLACSVFNTSATQAIYIYSDGTNYDPSSPTTSQSSGYATLSVKNHILMSITPHSGTQYEITVSANPTEGGTVSGAGTYYENGTCRLVATANTDYAFANWTKDGVVVSTNATYSFTVTEDASYVANFDYVKEYTVKIMPNDMEYGTVAFGSKDGENELTYDFEDGTTQGWTLLKGNTGDSPNNWTHVNDYVRPTYATSNYGHGSSDGWMLSESYISSSSSGSGYAVTPDNYFVSPQVRLGGSINFWVTDGNDEYGSEHFALLVSTTGNDNIDDFVQIQEWTLLSKGNGGTRTFTDGTWYEYTVDLSAYTGMGYLAIRHFNCRDMWLIGLDDITILEPTVSDGSVTASYVHGTSCTVVATPSEGYAFTNWTENGNVVATDASYTFEVTADHELVANFGVSRTFTKNIEAYTDNSGYYLIASPVGDVLATEVTNLVDGNFDLYWFDQTGDDEGKEWINYEANEFTALEAGKGYLYANEAGTTLTFTGAPVSNNNAVEVQVDYDANSDFAGLNLLGNPFAEEAYLVNANGMGLAYHRLNPETNLYVAVDDNAAIDMMEGVFYEAGENDDVVYFSTTAPTAKSNLNIVVSQGRGMVDNAIIRFGEGNTMKKIALFGNNTKVYVPQNGMEYAVVNATEFGEMPVNFKAEASGTYTMSFNSNNVEFSYLHLIDNLTGNDVDLVENPSYTFDANASDYSSRFKLVFATGDANNDSEFAFVSNGNIIVNGEGLLRVIDMTGRIVSSEQINGVSSIKLNAAAGVYVLQLNDKTQKIVVK